MSPAEIVRSAALAVICGGWTFLGQTAPTYAAEDGHWVMSPNGHLQAVLPLVDALTDKQRRLIDSGFSTFSQITLTTRGSDTKVTERGAIARVACTVKRDTWEEVYDISRLEPDPSGHTVKRFQEYADLCLRTTIKDPAQVSLFRTTGTMLEAQVQIEQISPQQATQLRDWLVKQQAGVMHGLFGHMLGDLAVERVAIVPVHLPPYSPPGARRDGAH